MLHQTCWSCHKSIAKRKCIATNQYICSICCGTKRKKEIDCPDECQYLTGSRDFWMNKLEIDQAQIDFWRSHYDLVNNFNFTLLSIRKTGQPDLNNNELKEALDNLVKTYETEQRGIIYEYKSANYRIQGLFDALQEIINRHRHIKQNQNIQAPSEEIKLRKVTLDQIIQCLKFIQGMLKQAMSKNISNTSYFDFISFFTSCQLVEPGTYS
jgi:hypothetical protein